MVKYLECSVCGNKAVDMPITNPKPICWNCCGSVEPEDFNKIDLETLFFEASSIQKMGNNRFILEIPTGLHSKVGMMSEKLRTGRWIAHLKSKFGG